MPPRRIIVTGTSGFAGAAIGRHLLAQGGTEVIGISRTPPRPGSCSHHLAHDLALPVPDPGFEADAIVHCAALSSPWASPQAYRRNNVQTLAQVLDLAKRVNCRHFVQISTTAVHYAFADQLRLSETSPLPAQPINHYAASKLECEAMVAASGLSHAILRPRALFGPGDTVLFPRILHAAGKGMLPRLVRPDGGEAMIELLYVDNLAWQVARVIQDRIMDTLILTNGEAVGAYTLLETVLKGLNLPVPTRKVPLRLAFAIARALELHSRLVGGWREPPVTRFGVASLAYSRTFDTSRSVSALGQPPVTMDDAVSRFIDWQRARQ